MSHVLDWEVVAKKKGIVVGELMDGFYPPTMLDTAYALYTILFVQYICIYYLPLVYINKLKNCIHSHIYTQTFNT